MATDIHGFPAPFDLDDTEDFTRLIIAAHLNMDASIEAAFIHWPKIRAEQQDEARQAWASAQGDKRANPGAVYMPTHN